MATRSCLLRTSRAASRLVCCIPKPRANPFNASHEIKSLTSHRQSRPYSIQTSSESTNSLPPLDASQLSITKTTTPKALSLPAELKFGHTFTDHMLSIEWTSTSGWLAPRITPYQNLSLDPATCVFHYGFECFEGMKAYRAADGSIRLFRPDKNMARFNSSAQRIALPSFAGEQLIELIKQLVKLDERFIPQGRGFSLYLRPTMIGTQRTLGVGPPGSALLYVICSPVGPYYPTGFKAVSLEATSASVRAWPGGAGDKKIGANYVPCIVPQVDAASRGFHQNLWVFGEDEHPTEAGTMNFFVVLKDKKSGQLELATPPLDGTILPGVTRDSVLHLARTRLQDWKVSERYTPLAELKEAAKEGRLVEAFGAGTAAVVSPIRRINWNGEDIFCGLKEGEESGSTALQMQTWIMGIQYGDEANEWSVTI